MATAEKKSGKISEELLVIGRMERLLAALPDDGARDRVMSYLVARHLPAKAPAHSAARGCNAPPLSPAG